MRKIIIFFLVACSILFVANPTTAQTLNGLSFTDKYLQSVRIGLVDEFIKRFNGQEFHPDISPQNKGARKKNLLMLFNLAMFKSQQDPYFKAASIMMDNVIKHNVRINYADTTWCAKALCVGTLKEKPIQFYLYLTVEHRSEDMYKWVIAKADGQVFDIKPKSKKQIMLSPDDHEIKFISLSSATTSEHKNIADLLSRYHAYDPTAVFMYLVYTGQLKINYVSELDFIFEQIPGYEFSISYFEREKNNLGWLVSSFRELSDTDKTRFLSSLYCSSADRDNTVPSECNNQSATDSLPTPVKQPEIFRSTPATTDTSDVDNN